MMFLVFFQGMVSCFFRFCDDVLSVSSRNVHGFLGVWMMFLVFFSRNGELFF